MAASHMACVRSSARASHQKASEDEAQIEVARDLSNELAVISISDDEIDNIPYNVKTGSSRGETSSTKYSNAAVETRKRGSNNEYVPPKILSTQLNKIESLSDTEKCLDPSVSQEKILSRLEQRWQDISENLERLIDHVQECTDEVVDASSNCLVSFKVSIDATCDKVDDETKALYHLISKCDSLTTKLSIASSFREEIKTLKKSVETLENLYKLRPQPQPQPQPQPSSSLTPSSHSISASSSSSTSVATTNKR